MKEGDKLKCPICKHDLEKEYEMCCSHGTEESKHFCQNCKLYEELFAYGSTDIRIGDFITGYSYTISDEEKKKLYDKIKTIAELYRKEIL